MVCAKLTTGVTYTNIRPTMQEFELHFAYSTPKLLQNIPNSVVYPYHYVDFYPQAGPSGAIADDNDYSINFNALNLSGIPRKMIVWISELREDVIGMTSAKLNKTDTSKAIIENISITFANKQGILS